MLAMVALSFLAGGCNDFLEENVRGQENLDTYFQDADEAQAFIMGNTSQPQEEYISLAHYQGVGQSNGSISDFWQYRYKGILRCNIALDRIPAIDMDANLKNG